MTPRSLPCVVVLAVALGMAECAAIEMFTFFGDGSRIGLPALEVPIEAYPGIPLRSDRIRMRRRSRRQAAEAAPRGGDAATPGAIGIREAPAPIPEGVAAPEPR